MVWNLLIWLVLGGIIGWIASLVMRTDHQQGILLNVVVGIVGAFIGALIFYRGDMQQPVKLESFIVALLGAILLLALINLFRRGRVR
ncbi:MAG: GlsB/YeaQ/YmgE family stress response membrane protein [Allosphingosinicella sp.]